MKLSTRARYGLSCMIAVARLSDDGEPVSLKRVSTATGISRRYLEQLVLPLRSAGLLASVSGRRGGYLLARRADSIRLREIVETAIGPISIVDCIAEPALCERSGTCENRLIYMVINDRVCKVLDDYALADLASVERLTRLCGQLGRSVEDVAQGPEEISELCARILEDGGGRIGP